MASVAAYIPPLFNALVNEWLDRVEESSAQQEHGEVL